MIAGLSSGIWRLVKRAARRIVNCTDRYNDSYSGSYTDSYNGSRTDGCADSCADNSYRGSALVIVLIVIFVLSTIGGVIIIVTNNNYVMSSKYAAWASDYYVLDTNAENALAQIDDILVKAEGYAYRYMTDECYKLDSAPPDITDDTALELNDDAHYYICNYWYNNVYSVSLITNPYGIEALDEKIYGNLFEAFNEEFYQRLYYYYANKLLEREIAKKPDVGYSYSAANSYNDGNSCDAAISVTDGNNGVNASSASYSSDNNYSNVSSVSNISSVSNVSSISSVRSASSASSASSVGYSSDNLYSSGIISDVGLEVTSDMAAFFSMKEGYAPEAGGMRVNMSIRDSETPGKYITVSLNITTPVYKAVKETEQRPFKTNPIWTNALVAKGSLIFSGKSGRTTVSGDVVCQDYENYYEQYDEYVALEGNSTGLVSDGAVVDIFGNVYSCGDMHVTGSGGSFNVFRYKEGMKTEFKSNAYTNTLRFDTSSMPALIQRFTQLETGEWERNHIPFFYRDMNGGNVYVNGIVIERDVEGASICIANGLGAGTPDNAIKDIPVVSGAAGTPGAYSSAGTFSASGSAGVSGTSSASGSSSASGTSSASGSSSVSGTSSASGSSSASSVFGAFDASFAFGAADTSDVIDANGLIGVVWVNDDVRNSGKNSRIRIDGNLIGINSEALFNDPLSSSSVINADYAGSKIELNGAVVMPGTAFMRFDGLNDILDEEVYFETAESITAVNEEIFKGYTEAPKYRTEATYFFDIYNLITESGMANFFVVNYDVMSDRVRHLAGNISAATPRTGIITNDELEGYTRALVISEDRNGAARLFGVPGFGDIENYNEIVNYTQNYLAFSEIKDALKTAFSVKTHKFGTYGSRFADLIDKAALLDANGRLLAGLGGAVMYYEGDGYLDLNLNRDRGGVVYCASKGGEYPTLTIRGDGCFRGVIISEGNIKITGNPTIMYDESLISQIILSFQEVQGFFRPGEMGDTSYVWVEKAVAGAEKLVKKRYEIVGWSEWQA